MVYRMWTRTVPVAGQQAQRTWEVQAARGEVGGARLQHPKQVVRIETLMIRATGPVNIAPMLMSGQPPFVRCASNAGKSRFPMKIYLPGRVGGFRLCLLCFWLNGVGVKNNLERLLGRTLPSILVFWNYEGS